MGILASMFRFERKKGLTPEACRELVVDLGEHACDGAVLGQPVPRASCLYDLLESCETIEDEKNGFHAATARARFDSVAVELARFPGRMACNGALLTTRTTIDEVREMLGEPYWRDDDEDETLLFYEHVREGVELQMEFSLEGFLRAVVMLREPLMADPEQRKAYGVTTPWPPR